MFNGTIVNVITVAVGAVVGVLAAGRLPERYRTIVLACLGLITITLGVDAGVIVFGQTVAKFAPRVDAPQTYGARLALVMIGSLLVGALIGTALRIHARIEGAGRWIHEHLSSPGNHAEGGGTDAATAGRGRAFAEGFLSASVIFCVGPLTLLGCLRNGAQGDPSYLYIKAMLDGFCAVALASSLGWGVLASVVTVLVFQGGLALLAGFGADRLPEVSLAMMNVVGGVILLATALMILEIKRIPVADLLPGIFLPPVVIWLCEWLRPGLLLPAM